MTAALTPFEPGVLALETQAATGRAYLHAAVTCIEHAAVLLADVPAGELVEAVPALAERIELALAVIRRGELPEAGPTGQRADGGLW